MNLNLIGVVPLKRAKETIFHLRQHSLVQADEDRSVGDLWSQITVLVKDAVLDLISINKTEESILLMQRFLQYEQLYEERSLKRKRNDQVKIIKDTLLSIKQSGYEMIQYASLLEEVEKLCKIQKGTFEWVDSVLARSMSRGNWLILDNANCCNASVLDRLNCLLEDGGKLVLSERGVLGENVITVPRHPGFRVFMLYDPIKGEISRAMRNRAVEVNLRLPKTGLTLDDKHQLLLACLGPAAASSTAIKFAVKASNDGLQNWTNQLTLLRQNVLSGAMFNNVSDNENVNVSDIKRKLMFPLACTDLAYIDSSLFNIIRQAKPLLIQSGMYALQQFLLYSTPNDIKSRSLLLGWLLDNKSLLLADQVGHSDLLVRSNNECLDWRLLPISATGHCESISDNLPNRRILVIRLMVGCLQLLEKTETCSSSLMAKASLCLEYPNIKIFPQIAVDVLEYCKNDIALSHTKELDNDIWDCIDKGIDWLTRFLRLGERTLNSHTEDMLSRAISLHWRWVWKKLRNCLNSIGADNAVNILDMYEETIKSSSSYTIKSTNKLK